MGRRLFFIRPYNLLSREVYLAIIDEAGRLKLPSEGLKTDEKILCLIRDCFLIGSRTR